MTAQVAHKIRKTEFEARIFVSIGLISTFSLLSFGVYDSTPDIASILLRPFDLEDHVVRGVSFMFIAFMLCIASLLRVWAGSTLTSSRVMSFKVLSESLVTTGPYSLVRNPIYLADILAMCTFTLLLKPIGLLFPPLFCLHYTQLIKYEEHAFQKRIYKAYESYLKSTPKLFPSIASLKACVRHLRHFHINYDGLRHNALYILFIPGFILATWYDSLTLALIIGIPAVLDWAIIHTVIGVAPSPKPKEEAQISQSDLQLKASKVFGDVLYAQCWEDPQIDRTAFEISNRDTVFTITSGGCNALTFLIDNPQKIIALDLNPAQNHLLRLKIAAFKALDYEDMLAFLGVIPCNTRIGMYQIVSRNLEAESRDFWDHHLRHIEDGIIHCGRFEKYMRLLRRGVKILLGRHVIDRLFLTYDTEAQRTFYARQWDNWRWRLFTGMFLNRWVMTALFDKAFFAQLTDAFSFSAHFHKVAERGITKFPVRENPFLSYMMRGSYSDPKHLPVYLQREHFETIRERLERITLISGDCAEYFARVPDNAISKFNFTNIFEWMPVKEVEALLRETIRVARDGAVLTYRNLLVDRSRPITLAQSIHPDPTLSHDLHAEDRSFIYKTYVVERIHK